MKATYLSFPAGVLIFAPCCAIAATTLPFIQPVNSAIPDNNGSGLVSVIPVSTGGQTITSVEVTLTTSSGWNGDLYAYLEHNGVISVLLNRPGRTDANPAGAASSGLTVTLMEAAPLDIHTAISGVSGVSVTGIYQPDARAADPGVVTETSPRSLYLSGFTGQIADGKWTLFVADLADGGVSTLNNWGISLNVVPEAGAALLGGLGLLTLLRRKRDT